MLGIWQRVKHIMEVKGLTNFALENDLGLSTSQVSSWIRNDRYPRADVALKIADYFNVSIQWLLTGDDPNALDPNIVRLIKNKTLLELMFRIEKCNMRQINAIGVILDTFDK